MDSPLETDSSLGDSHNFEQMFLTHIVPKMETFTPLYCCFYKHYMFSTVIAKYSAVTNLEAL
jgi:hypothetical protein